MRFHEKAVIITGAGSGIGRATALAFAREGARVLAADQNEDASAETAAMLRADGAEASSCRVDVTLSEEVEAMVRRCLDDYRRIDILCNIAGIGSTQNVVDTPDDLWDRVMEVNVRGVFLGCKHAIPHMLDAGGGVIVNMASVAGLVGIKNRAAYCASKAAVIGLTKAIAIDHVGEGIRSNCVCPGTVGSPWVDRLLADVPDPAAGRAALEARQPMGRLGTPEEVAEAVLYLASDSATFITGTALTIDGGWTAQ